MKAVKSLILVAVLALAAGCGQSIKGASDYDRRVNFQSYSTYFFVKGTSTGDPPVDAGVMEGVESALLNCGWIQVPTGEGSAVVIVNIATDRQRSYQDFFKGWDGWHWQLENVSDAKPFVETYPVGTVVVTVFDAGTKHALWRGFATDVIRTAPKKGSNTRDAAMAKLFKSFPTASYMLTTSAMSALTDAAPAPGDVPTNDPLNVVFFTSPAVLVRIDGEPKFENVEGTSLERIMNTNAFIVRDDTGSYYLRILDGWMQSYSLDGSWDVTMVPPAGAQVALTRATESKDRTLDLLNGQTTGRESAGLRLLDRPPAVFVSTTPTVLLMTNGAPQYAEVPGTSLQYVANTSATMFREPIDQELYLFVGDRWYRSWKPEGPWRSVAGADLPKELPSAVAAGRSVSGGES